MPTNLAIDDKLIMEAFAIGHHKTKKEAVTSALREYIRRRKQGRILDREARSNTNLTATTKPYGEGARRRSRDGARRHLDLLSGVAPLVVHAQ
jgi:Arc/MetJ family transcription regulator